MPAKMAALLHALHERDARDAVRFWREPRGLQLVVRSCGWAAAAPAVL